MSVLHVDTPNRFPLSTGDGELILVTVETESRGLERLLETLAGLPFPVNPQIHHPAAPGGPTRVEFPAYASQFDAARPTLAAWRCRIAAMLDVIAR